VRVAVACCWGDATCWGGAICGGSGSCIEVVRAGGGCEFTLVLFAWLFMPMRVVNFNISDT
jgi:hypothetical protein